jgi:tetratricopeptide (TPR) repeat protein
VLRDTQDAEYFVSIIESSLSESRGDLQKAMDGLPAVSLTRSLQSLESLESGVYGVRARVAYNAGDIQMARSEMELWAATGGGEPFPIDECLVVLGSEEIVRREYGLLTGQPRVVGSGMSIAPTQDRVLGLWASLDRQRGALAMRLGMVEEAERHFRDGAAWTEREGAPVEQGRCLPGLSEIADQRGDRAEAGKLLDQAMELFQRHGAQLYLRQVLSKKEILKA